MQAITLRNGIKIRKQDIRMSDLSIADLPSFVELIVGLENEKYYIQVADKMEDTKLSQRILENIESIDIAKAYAKSFQSIMGVDVYYQHLEMRDVDITCISNSVYAMEQHNDLIASIITEYTGDYGKVLKIQNEIVKINSSIEALGKILEG